MANTFLIPIDLTNNEIRNALAQLLGADPTGVEGKFIYHTGTKVLKFYNGTAWISLGTLDQISAPAADVSLATFKITNLGAPSGDNDAARKVYVDDAISTLTTAVNAAVRGLAWKDSVRAATTVAGGNINLASAPASIDGISLDANDRVLVKNQTLGEANGIYVFNGAASAMTRAVDADAVGELEGATVMVEEGTAGENTAWTQTADNFILDTDPLTWVQFGSSTTIGAGAGLVVNGGDFDVNVGDGIEIVADAVTADLAALGGLEFATGEIAVNVGPGLELDETTGAVQIENDGVLGIDNGGTSATTAAAARTALGVVNHEGFAANVGDAAATSFNVDHNLNSLDVLVQVVRNSDGASVFADITRTTVNRVVAAFAVAPASNAYRILVSKVA